MHDFIHPLLAAGGGSVLDRWVFEQPWPLGVGLLGAGMLVMYVLVARGEWKRGVGAGGALVLAGALVLIAGYAVTTTREHLIARGGAFVDAFFAADASAVGEALDPAFRLSAAGRDARGVDREAIMRLASSSAAFQVKKYDYAEQPGGSAAESSATTRFRVRVYTPLRGYSGVPLTTAWEAQWSRVGDVWTITSLDMIDSSDGVPSPEMIERWRGVAGG